MVPAEEVTSLFSWARNTKKWLRSSWQHGSRCFMLSKPGFHKNYSGFITTKVGLFFEVCRLLSLWSPPALHIWTWQKRPPHQAGWVEWVWTLTLKLLLCLFVDGPCPSGRAPGFFLLPSSAPCLHPIDLLINWPVFLSSPQAAAAASSSSMLLSLLWAFVCTTPRVS